MCKENQTEVTEILLLGFKSVYNQKTLLFVLFLLVYIAILGANLIIIVLVAITDHLNIPMFCFLKHLALADVILTTSVVPFMLHIMIMKKRTLSIAGCITQLYIFCISGFVQCLLLAVMSYDRYLAICHPLNYNLIMSPKVCLQLVYGSWFLVFTLITTEIILVFQLQYCGLNFLDHFFCDFGPVVKLSTSDTSTLMLLDFFISITLIFVPFVFIIITYILIVFTIIRIPSVTARRKLFFTCSSHLTIVCTYYVALFVVYLMPSRDNSMNLNKFRSLLYIIVTPLMNPIIYSLRNTKIRVALRKVVMQIIVIIH
ncbi:olfactory receptor 10J5-like [Pelobates fuscus]|uniref:olfactory receptor 10J5-like n=1 Tax=Pelobates fuscus TaxID=191477 RepID=UPI002FE4A1BA